VRRASGGPSVCRELYSHVYVCGRLNIETAVLWTVFVILLVLWLLGIVSAYTFGGFIHVLLALAVAVVLMRVIQGQRPID
jgi:Family of unknown function (DUF5670)